MTATNASATVATANRPPPEPLITGALGAALIGKETYERELQSGRPPQRSGRDLREATFFS